MRVSLLDHSTAAAAAFNSTGPRPAALALPQQPGPSRPRAGLGWCLLGLALVMVGCRTVPQPGTAAARVGDEIVVAGQFIHTGTPVVTWLDPGGYDAYRVERRFAPLDQSDWDQTRQKVRALETPNRYGLRREPLTPQQLEQVRGGGWDLPTLTNLVDQFVIHYDATGTSRQCFKVLHDLRGLSAHFLLDLDGTLYQTLDLKERGWHATTSNTRSVGIEIAHIGAFPPGRASALKEWYPPDAQGQPRLVIPARLGESGIRTPGFVGRPARPEPVSGTIQGLDLVQYDFTPEQYRALARLTATLCRVFPKIHCDYPRDDAGQLVTEKLADTLLANYQGVLGHFHIQTNKIDPGPAFQWDEVIRQARDLLRAPSRAPVPSPKGASLW